MSGKVPEEYIKPLQQLLLIKQRLPAAAFRSKRDQILEGILAVLPAEAASDVILALKDRPAEAIGLGAESQQVCVFDSEDEVTDWLLRTVEVPTAPVQSSTLPKPSLVRNLSAASASSSHPGDVAAEESAWVSADEPSTLKGSLKASLLSRLESSELIARSETGGLRLSLARILNQVGEIEGDVPSVGGFLALVARDEEQDGRLLEEFVEPMGQLYKADLPIMHETARLLLTLPKIAQARRVEEDRMAMVRALTTGWIQLWGSEREQMCIVPRGESLPAQFFLYVEGESDGGAAALQASVETILVYWDISQSMNNTPSGKYLPSDSADGETSNMRRARDLIPDLALSALRQGCDLRIIPWNHMCPAVVKERLCMTTFQEKGEQISPLDFKSSDFQNEEARCLDEDRLLTEVKRASSDDCIRAQGATCMEAALWHMHIEVAKLAAESKRVVVWFLTDGEATFYMSGNDTDAPLLANFGDSMGSGMSSSAPADVDAASQVGPLLSRGQACKRFPAKRQNLPEHFDFFKEEDLEGVTAYQHRLLTTILHPLATRTANLDRPCELSFHFVGFGDANAATLGFLAGGLGGSGIFHSITELSTLRDELRAVQATAGLELVLTGSRSGAQQRIRGAFSERLRAYVFRGELDTVVFQGDVACAIQGGMTTTELQGTTSGETHASGEVATVCLRVSAPFLGREQRSLGYMQMHPEASLARGAQEAMNKVLSLDSTLTKDIEQLLGSEPTQERLKALSTTLQNVRRERLSALTSVTQSIRPANGILSSFLHECLRSTQLSVGALERQLRQHYSGEGEQYDAGRRQTGHGHEYWQRHGVARPDALKKGLRSLQLQLGSGISQEKYDGRVAELLARTGPQAKRNLRRRCLVAEDNLVEGEDLSNAEVLLMLLILNEAQWEAARQRAIRRLASIHSEDAERVICEALMQGSIRYDSYSERLCHNVEAVREGATQWESLQLEVKCRLLAGDAIYTLQGKICAADLYEDHLPSTDNDGTEEPPADSRVKRKQLYHDRYFARVQWQDLQNARHEYSDPFSQEDFLDLIRDNSTLPALLYVVDAAISPGLLYDAKETLYVRSSGAATDRASFESFRLFYDANELTDEGSAEDQLIQFPGTFCRANFALPVAPEPLSNKVLSQLLHGPLGSFITGTPMALLSEAVHFYFGFIMMHLRPPQFRVHPDDATDASEAPAVGSGSGAAGIDRVHMFRVAQLLCTAACWLDDPRTYPGRSEIWLLVDDAVSEGRFPTKAPNMRQVTSEGPEKGKFRAKGRAGGRVRHEKVGTPSMEILFDSDKWELRVDGTAQYSIISREERPPEGAWLPVSGEGAPIKVTEINPPPVSPGKFIPVRGLCYALLDDRADGPDLASKYGVVLNTILHRYLSHMFTAQKDTRERVDAKIWLAGLLEDLCMIDGDSEPPEIPEGRLETALRLRSAVVEHSPSAVQHFKEPSRLAVISRAVATLLLELLAQACPTSAHWWVQQRLMFQFFIIGSFGIQPLKKSFREFKQSTPFDAHVGLLREALPMLDWPKVLWTSVSGSGSQAVLLVIHEDLSMVEVRVQGGAARYEPLAHPRAADLLWELFAAIATSHFAWKGRPSTCYGLAELDYDVARVLLGQRAPSTLDNTQMDVFNAAVAWKRRDYAVWNKCSEAPAAPIKIDSDVRINIKDRPREMEQEKPRLSFVFIGEKNAGKSTTAGRLIIGTGSSAGAAEGDRMLKLAQRYNKVGDEWAWVMDRLREERERGATITAKGWNIQSASKELDLIDAPGDRSFLSNMVFGATLSDAAVMLVSAKPGEFEMGILPGGDHKAGVRRGLTHEEPEMAYALGIGHLIVAVNKMDSVEWSRSRFEEICAQVSEILRKTGASGYITRGCLCFVPVASYHGHNIVERFEGEELAWYTGSTFHGQHCFTLLDALDALPERSRATDAPLCMVVAERPQKVRGVGTIVVGQVVHGTVRIGDRLTLRGAGKQIETVVKSVELWHTQRQVGNPGERLGLQLRAADGLNEVSRGMVVSPPRGDGVLLPHQYFEAQVAVTKNVPNEVKVGWEATLHCHMLKVTVRLRRIVWKIGKETGGKKMDDPHSLKSKEMATVLFEFSGTPQVIARFVDHPELGRFILVNNHECMMLGKIMQVSTVDEISRSAAAAKAPSRLSNFKPSMRR